MTPAKGSNNGYASSCDVAISGITWNVTGNASLTPWRIGGKSLSSVDRAVYSKTAMSSAITKVELTVGAASGITVNSLKLIVASDNAFSSKIDEVSETFAANSTITFTPSPTKNWTSGAYYKFVFNVTVSGTSNKFVEFSEAKFYKEESVAYKITAVSNDEAKGTVSIDGSTITASPEPGYRVSTSTSYEITSGTATVVDNGDNTFSVTPTSDCTVRINFEAIPTHTATFSVNGETSGTDFAEGESIVFPDDPEDINGKKFVGWLDETIKGSTDVKPSFVTTATMGNADVIYYAVFATVAGSEVIKTDVLNRATTGITGTSYSEWSGKKVTSDAVYAGNSAGGNEAIQLRSNNSNSGVITTTSGGKVKKVTVDWNSDTADDRTLNVYGKNSAYSEASDLYGDNSGTLLGTIVKGTSTELTITGDYEYVGLRSASGAMYLNSVSINWEISSITYSAYCTTVSDKPVPTITFKNSGDVAITELNATATEMEAVSVSCSAGDVTITVESDDDTVAEYDEGYVLAYKSGTATLTATFAGNDAYQGTTATLTVNVAKKATTTTVGVEIDDTDIYTATEGGLAAATVKAGDATITPAAVTWTSSATNVATIDAEGNITLVGVGTTTITASYAGTDVYDASQGTYELTLTSSEPQKTNINITPNYEFYGKNAQFSGSTYDVLTGQQDNVSVTYTRNTGSTYANTTAMRFYKDNNLEISAPSGYHIIGITLTLEDLSSDITTNVDTYTAGTGVWSGNASSVTFSRPSNASSYATIRNIAVTLAPTVTISAAEYATYCNSTHDLDFSETGITVYTAEDNGETVRLNEIAGGQVPANTPVVLYKEGADGSAIAVPVIAEAAAVVVSNDLEVSDGESATGEDIYVLANKSKGVGFYPWTSGSSLSAGKVFLRIAGGSAREFIGFEEGETTSLREIRNEELGIKNAEFFNLNGQRVATPVKGNIYIVNGRKVVIK